MKTFLMHVLMLVLAALPCTARAGKSYPYYHTQYYQKTVTSASSDSTEYTDLFHTHVEPLQPFAVGSLWDVEADPRGGVWYATSFGGLFFLNGETSKNWGPESDYRNIVPPNKWEYNAHEVSDIFITSSGTILIAPRFTDDSYGWHEGGQIATFDGEDFTSHPESVQFIMKLDTDSKGNIWAATIHEGLAWNFGSVWIAYRDFNSDIRHNDLVNVAVDSNDNIWIAYTGNLGCSCYDGERWEHFLDGYTVRCLVSDKNGGIWVGTSESVFFIKDNESIQMSEDDVNEPDNIWSIEVDRAGVLWVGAMNGLFMRKGTLWEKMDLPLPGTVSEITADIDNIKWFATFQRSLHSFSLQTGPFVNIVTPNGGEVLQGGEICSIEWTSNDVGTIDIMYSRDNGETWHSIADNVDAKLGSYSWSVPDIYIMGCRLKLAVRNDFDMQDMSDGLFMVDSEVSIHDHKPVVFLINQNYPNPFNPSTTITYSLSEGDYTRIEVFDVTGRIVEALVDEWRDAGRHSIVWDASDQAAGLYFCKVTSGANSEVMKMMLVK